MKKNLLHTRRTVCPVPVAATLEFRLISLRLLTFSSKFTVYLRYISDLSDASHHNRTSHHKHTD